MYINFYNFQEPPFNITPDPSFYFSSAHHHEAFSHLIYGIENRKGILVITGEVGTGKTTLCRTLLGHLNGTTKTALILNPTFSEVQLLQMIIKDLGIETKEKTKFGLISALNDFLLEENRLGNNIVLIIDEAQNLKIRQLEQIRLLSNLETEKEKLLQIIIVGQPELLDMLKLASLRQLNQRVTVRYHMQPLGKNEVARYIKHRLKTAGPESEVSFTPEAFERIYLHSQGTPRLINVICDRALLAGFVKETFTIDDQIVDHCLKEFT